MASISAANTVRPPAPLDGIPLAASSAAQQLVHGISSSFVVSQKGGNHLLASQDVGSRHPLIAFVGCWAPPSHLPPDVWWNPGSCRPGTQSCTFAVFCPQRANSIEQQRCPGASIHAPKLSKQGLRHSGRCCIVRHAPCKSPSAQRGIWQHKISCQHARFHTHVGPYFPSNLQPVVPADPGFSADVEGQQQHFLAGTRRLRFVDDAHQMILPELHASVRSPSGVIKTQASPNLHQPVPCIGPGERQHLIGQYHLLHGDDDGQWDQTGLPRRPQLRCSQP